MSDHPTSEQDTYTAPVGGWTCFHCGENFPPTRDGVSRARQHFGRTPDSEPACRVLNTEYGFVRRLRALEDERDEMRRQRDVANNELEKLVIQLSEWAAMFPDCKTARDLFNKYEAMEGRALAAEERVAELE